MNAEMIVFVALEGSSMQINLSENLNVLYYTKKYI